MAEDRGGTEEDRVRASLARVEGWLAALAPADATTPGSTAPAEREEHGILDGLRDDADSFDFLRRLLDALAGEADPFAAALSLRSAAQELPPSLPARDRLAVRAGGLASLGLPWAVLPLARRRLRERVAHLILSARLPGREPEQTDARLRETLRANAAAGFDTLLAPSGDPVLGPEGAADEIARLAALAALPGATSIAVDPARVVPGGSWWSLDADAARAADLAPLLDVAEEHGTVVVFEGHDHRSALLATELALLALGPHERAAVRAGVHLAADLPESADAAERLAALSRARVARGGEPLELIVGRGGFAGQARIDSLLSGLPVPVFDSEDEARAGLLRLVRKLAGHAGAVRTVIATEDPLLLAAATVLAEAAARPAVQLRAGTVPALARTLADHGFAVRLRLPVFAPKTFGSAAGPLVRLAAEAADPESDLSRAARVLHRAPRADPAEREELARAFELADRPAPPSHRTQRRSREWNPSERDSALFYRPPAETGRFDTGGLTAAVLGLGADDTGRIVLEPTGEVRALPVVSGTGFANEPDTDASSAENRDWARRLLARASAARGVEAAAVAQAREAAADTGALLDLAAAAAEPWRAQRAAERSIRVARLALGLASARDRLIEESVAESGAPIASVDADVSGAIDATRYLGQLAAGLGAVRGAEFVPGRIAVVVADAGVPLAERAEAVAAVLAAGSAAVLVAHPSLARSSAALIEEWRAAGLPEGTVSLAVASEAASGTGGADASEETPDSAGAASDPHIALAAGLAADPRVDRAQVLGRRETARALLRRRPDLRVEGRFRALGSTLIAPNADLPAAVRDAVRSAFGGAAADARSARVLVLLGSAARSKRLRRLLADAVRNLRVGDAAAAPEAAGTDPLVFDLGPLASPPGPAGLRALTELQPGEEWLVRPEQLDDAGLLWRPGVRTGVRRDARFWADAIGVPVLGVVSAHSLDEAIRLQGALGGGSTAALHAGGELEIIPWLDGVRAAALVVGRATVDARIERHPGGGWGGAGTGGDALTGGPNRLTGLGSWRLREGTPSSTLHLRGLDPRVRSLIETAQSSLGYEEFDRVRRAALSDALAWRTSLGRVHDEVGLGIERNVLRHHPVHGHVRLAERGSSAELVRVLAAGLLVGAPLTVSTGEVLPPELSRFLEEQEIPVSLERDDDWLERTVATETLEGPEAMADRVRLIGGDPRRTAEWLGGLDRVPLWTEPVTMAGPVELLVFLREQSVSIAAHRHGFAAPPPGVDEWLDALDARVDP
ncbi:aldehyde dehydrogenase family protein [Leucobacter weissii]|uniref:Aldehyde dehydrogenase family protein n=1 Tax=Leucobacter weissii TaxID=1983706 RepID=A0A939MK09_9MICO|nr:aldehyde dehydrogenase family protein [Leucobacter weissii]MBO1901395.1 aldehyde dehydrogenase family protein [Leucobacter weissii]